MEIDDVVIKAVLFDMDGLMLDTERMAQTAWQRAGAEQGYEFSTEIYLNAVGRTVRDTEKIFQQAFGDDFPFQDLYDRKQQYFYQMLESDPIPTKPGLLELLDQVDELGLSKAVATSTSSPFAIKKLTITGLIERFQTIVCGDEIARGKPAPDIFLEAASRLDIAPLHCLVLEDSEAGIHAAHAAGMTPIMVPDLKQPSTETEALAHSVLPSLNEVQSLLRRL